MKLQNSHYITLVIIIALLLISSQSYAQLPIFEDDVRDEPVAPINGLIALGLAVGGYLGVKKVRK